ESVEHHGQWLRRAEHPELPGCVVEAPSAVEALEELERERRRGLRRLWDAGGIIPVPRPPLRDSREMWSRQTTWSTGRQGLPVKRVMDWRREEVARAVRGQRHGFEVAETSSGRLPGAPDRIASPGMRVPHPRPRKLQLRCALTKAWRQR